MEIQYLSVSWTQYHALTQKLADAILKNENEPFDEIVAIGRGGLSVGLILSDYLRLPICSFTIQSYTDIKKQGILTVTETLGREIRNKQILLVDDNADSGKTFFRAVKYLKDFHPASITTASVFYKPWSTYKPDYYAKETTRWILFPHEVTEWIYTYSTKMASEGKSEMEIHTFLESIGYTDSQIKFVQTYHLQ